MQHLRQLLTCVWVLALLLAAAHSGCRAAENNVDAATAKELTLALSAIPDRAQGMPGSATAAALIADRLRALGLEPILIRHGVSVPADRGSRLTIDGRDLTVMPLAPNNAATAGTGATSLHGPLVFGGHGSFSELAGKPLPGAIVVLDRDARMNWTNAAMLGAQAVIIRGADGLDRSLLQPLAVPASLPFPRFAIGDLHRALDGQQASLSGQVAWEDRAAISVCALIKPKPAAATGDEDAAKLASELAIITAGYEANGPATTAGAMRAWNAGALLSLTAGLVRDPPKRAVLVVFSGARGEFFRGIREITGALTTGRAKTGFAPKNDLDELLALYRGQRWQAEAMTRVLGATGPFSFTTALAAIDVAWTASDVPPPSRIDESRLEPGRLFGRVLAIAAAEQADERMRPLETLRLSWAERDRLALDEAARTALKTKIAQDEVTYQRWRTSQQKLDAAKVLTTDEDAAAGLIVPRALYLLGQQAAWLDRRIPELESLLALRVATVAYKPVAMLGLDLSDGNDRFATISDGFYVDWGGDLSWLNVNLAGSVAKELRKQGVQAAYDDAPWKLPSDYLAWWPEGYQHEAAAAGVFVTATTISTTSDQRLKSGAPTDTPTALRWENLDRQAKGLAGFVRGLADSKQLSGRTAKISPDRFRIQTASAVARAVGTKIGTRGMPFPHVFQDFGNRNDWQGDIAMRETRWGDLYGSARATFLPGQHTSSRSSMRMPVRIYTYHDDGTIRAMVSSKGQQRYGDSSDLRFKINSKERVSDILAMMIEGETSTLYQISDPRLLAQLATVRPLAASRDSEPNLAGIEVADGQAVTVTEPEVRLRMTATQGKIGNRMVLTGKRSADARGQKTTAIDWTQEGLAHGLLSRDTAADVGTDMTAINNQRIELLRRNGIDSDSLVAQHAKAELAVSQAAEAKTASQWDRQQAAGHTAWAYAGRVYPSLLSTANDVVYGLVVLLFFAIPFAIVCERLFIAGSTIGRKVAGFTTFFIAVFLFFFLFHPAFALATTPMVVFLAFLILLMSIWVISVIVGRFELEMQRIRMAGMGQHTADVSRLGTLVATMGLGISNMRRRRMRTFLTTSTVVLMTFILLTFASFTPSVGSRRVDIEETPAFTGVMLRHNGWSVLVDEAEERIQLGWGDRFNVVPLRWIAPTFERPRIPLAGPGGQASVSGIAGVADGDPSGVLQALVRGPLDDPASPRGLPPGAEADQWIFLPDEVLTRLGAKPGTTVRLKGLDLKAGVLDGRTLAAARYLAGGQPTPLSLEGVDKMPGDEDRLNQVDATGTPSAETGSVIHLGPSSVGVVSVATARQMGGKLRALALVPRHPDVDVASEADGLASQLAMTVRVGTGGQSFQLTSVGRMSVAGLGAVLVPLILGGLIIFSTMLNSVAERGREIFIYASLGLAPIHVAALFLVEAGIYAVLGGLGGYMLAQILTWLLGVAAAHGYGVQPDLNYSSFTAVATIILVMLTVLISALYPAWVASKAANPGTKDFVLPEPAGDTLDIEFPFTVAAKDVEGLMTFLKAWFEANSEASTGCFTAADARTEAVVRGEGRTHAVEARTWLAPFDLGISQHFRLECRPTDMKAIFAVHVRLDLLSGQRSNWRRANIAFMKALRLQFLVWRTLTPEAQGHYRAIGAAASAPPSAVPATA